MKRSFTLFTSFVFFINTSFILPNGLDYTLIIKKGTYSNEGLHKVLSLPIVLMNNTDSTLSYISTVCSWKYFYLIDNKNFTLKNEKPEACTRDFPIIVDIPAHKSKEVEIPIRLLSSDTTSTLKFRVGFRLIKDHDQSGFKAYLEYYLLNISQVEPGYVVWSNEMEWSK